MVMVTRDETPLIGPVIGASISATIRDRIRDLRERAGLDRAELADRAREHGAPESTTANVVGGGEAGQLEAVVRRDIAGLGELGPLEETLTATAVRLASAIDAARGDEAVKDLPKLTRELRATTVQILDGRRRVPDPDDEDDLDDLDSPE
jgi:hypothetical protein